MMSMIAMEGAEITVNGIAITRRQIDLELPNHLTGEPDAVRRVAIRALVVRELLIQEAVKWGLCDRDGALNQPEKTIEKLLALQIKVPAPDEASCQRYFDEHRNHFSTAPQCEVSHIFYAARLEDAQKREQAKQRARAALEKINANPELFEAIAKAESDCSSASQGGSLGRITKGQTMPAFESAVMAMSKGAISSELVETEVGFHIIRVDEREEGEGLPFEVLKSWITQYLGEQSWQKAVGGYVDGLAERAEIIGFEFCREGESSD